MGILGYVIWEGFNPLPPSKGREITDACRPCSAAIRFNPLPPSKGREMTGDLKKYAKETLFQSAPALEGAGDKSPDRSAAIMRCFNPLPPSKGREIGPTPSSERAEHVSIRSRPRRGGRCLVDFLRGELDKFQSAPALEGAGDRAGLARRSSNRGFNPLPPSKGREIR